MPERKKGTSEEYSWEMLMADIKRDRAESVIQGTIAERIVFPIKGGTYSEFVQSFAVLSSEKGPTRFPLNISNLEVVLPFLWEKEGWIKGLEQRHPGTNEGTSVMDYKRICRLIALRRRLIQSQGYWELAMLSFALRRSDHLDWLDRANQLHEQVVSDPLFKELENGSSSIT